MAGAKPIDTVLRYHALSTHHPSRFARGPGRLDWATQPDPFRTYEGAPVLDLPLAGDDLEATWEDLHRPGAVPPRALDRGSLGAFLELALGLTAWKEYGSARWSLRANPSSGNLHPTEGYALVPGAPGLEGGLYHYVSRDHVIERRWTPEVEDRVWLEGAVPHDAFLVGLASIHWREAWKYGERAFRYCQHDAGHALASVRYAAAVLGWSARLLEAPGDDDVARLLGLDREEDAAGLPAPDREHPDALVLVAPPDQIGGGLARVEATMGELTSRVGRGQWAGRPNGLSPAHVEWPEIDAVAAACRKPRTSPGGSPGPSAVPAPHPSRSRAPRAVALIRQRRSAVDMDGRTSLAKAAFLGMLDRLLPRAAVPPWDLVPWRPRIHPVLFVHRVDGLTPGVYLLERDASVHEELSRVLRESFRWATPDGAPPALGVFLLEDGDARSFARFASCHQGIASESAFSLGMLGVFEESLAEGAWWYRRLFWETGILGQVLYLEAEAAGLRATGIGCYFDDVVREVLGLEGAAFRDLYHFTVGGPVDDPRLATRPAYGDDVHRRG